MTPSIITYFLCGMRHPNTGLSEDDLSRLTGSSSSTASVGSSSSSSSSTSSAENTPHRKDCGITHEVAVENVLTATHKQQSTEKTTTNGNYTHAQQVANTSTTTTTPPQRFNSTYLPEFINPLEWQKSRKRKERLDSTSSATQDRKLHRSNSEELLPQQKSLKAAATAARAQEAALLAAGIAGTADNGGRVAPKTTKAAVDVIRRVSSEDFKKTTSYAAYLQELNEAAENCGSSHSSLKEKGDKEQEAQLSTLQRATTNAAVDENDASLANRQEQQLQLQQQQQQQQSKYDSLPTPFYLETWLSGPTRDMRRRARYETSPMRSQRHSPVRSVASNNGNGNGKHSDSNDSECENERRRSSERFCKSRGPPGRKAAGVTKKNSSGGASGYLPSKRGDEAAYKYDLSALKHERRGFISKKVADKGTIINNSLNDVNDNNLIDFQTQKQQQQQQQQEQQLQKQQQLEHIKTTNAANAAAEVAATTKAAATPSTTITTTTRPTSPPIKKTNNSMRNYPSTSAQEALPWDRSVPEDQTPILSRRYAAVRLQSADNLDTAAKLSKVMPYPQPLHKQTTAQMMAEDMDDCMDEPLNAYRAFTSLENVRTHDIMQQVIPAMMSFQTPEERLKQVNKRLTALKKKLAQLEEAYEVRMGYRPSQVDRLNDKYMKNILAELSKLRKERHDLKADPMGALGFKVSGGMNDAKKLEKMKAALIEIEESLAEKRNSAKRSAVLEELTPDQLVQEKTAVQHGLLYLESLFGRPATKEERDTARPLYERYRQLKRMVSRSVQLLGCAAAGAPELPTILEDEAMVFELTPQQYSSNNSTDTTNSPSDSVAPPAASSDDSTITTTAPNVAAETTATTTTTTVTPPPAAAADTRENINALSIEQLWEQLDRTREEKKMLKRTIREYETVFEEQNGRKMLKNDRKMIEETYAQYKERKAKTRLLEALIKKQISR